MTWTPWSAACGNLAPVRRSPAAAGRRYRPALELLEDRAMLTIESLSAAGFTATALPRMAGAVAEEMRALAGGRPLTVTYARGLQADVFLPPHFNPLTERFPAVALFFPGGLYVGDPSFWFPAAAYFAEHGIVAISFQYRLGGVDGAAQSVSDARTALRWMREYAPQFGIDPGRVAAVGTSAGAYLALMTALGSNQPDELYLDQPVTPNAIVAIAPIVENGSAFPLPAALTPADLAPRVGLPPTLLLQGTADTLPATLFAYTVAFAASTPNTLLIPFPGLDHGTIASGAHLPIDVLVLQNYLAAIGLAPPG